MKSIEDMDEKIEEAQSALLQAKLELKDLERSRNDVEVEAILGLLCRVVWIAAIGGVFINKNDFLALWKTINPKVKRDKPLLQMQRVLGKKGIKGNFICHLHQFTNKSVMLVVEGDDVPGVLKALNMKIKKSELHYTDEFWG